MVDDFGHTKVNINSGNDTTNGGDNTKAEKVGIHDTISIHNTKLGETKDSHITETIPIKEDEILIERHTTGDGTVGRDRV